MLKIDRRLSIPMSEIDITAIRSQGAGGQHVNKASTAVHVRFDVLASTALCGDDKERLLRVKDRRMSKDGVIVIKAQRFRSRDRNRADALEKLATMIRAALARKKPRTPTRPTKSSQQKRLDEKSRRGRLKRIRGKVIEDP